MCHWASGRRIGSRKSGNHLRSFPTLEPFDCAIFRSAVSVWISLIAAAVRAHGTLNMGTFANQQLMPARLHTLGLKPSVASIQAGKETNAMKLTIKTKRYALNTACGCPKAAQSHCGVNYRAG